MNTLGTYDRCSTYGETSLLIWTASLINISFFHSCFFTHFARANQQIRYRHLYCLKCIGKTIQSTICAPTSRLKHRNKCTMYLTMKQYSRVKQTDRVWFTSLRIFLRTELIIPIFSQRM